MASGIEKKLQEIDLFKIKKYYWGQALFESLRHMSMVIRVSSFVLVTISIFILVNFLDMMTLK